MLHTQPEARKILKAKRNYKGGSQSSMMNLVKTDLNSQKMNTIKKNNAPMFFGKSRKIAWNKSNKSPMEEEEI